MKKSKIYFLSYSKFPSNPYKPYKTTDRPTDQQNRNTIFYHLAASNHQNKPSEIGLPEQAEEDGRTSRLQDLSIAVHRRSVGRSVGRLVGLIGKFATNQ